MKAVVLAAGEGLRLRPLTANRPKVMIKIANKPILEYVVTALVANNIREIDLVVGYRKEQIMTYFGDGTRWGAKISYVMQHKQLGTAHALYQAKDRLEGRFLVLPGDNIIDPETIQPLASPKKDWAVVIARSPTPSKYGVVSLDGKPIRKIVEKPEQEISNLVSTGIYQLSEEIFEQIENVSDLMKKNDMTSVIQHCIDNDLKVLGEMSEGRWIDAVYPWDLLPLNAEALKDIEISRSGKVEHNVIINGPVVIGEGSVIRSGTYIQGPVVIGKGCEIGPNVVILPATTLGNNVTVNPFTEIRNSVVMSDVSIGGSSVLSHTVIGDGCQIGSHFSSCAERATAILEKEIHDIEYIGSILADDVKVGNQVTVSSGVVIGPNSKIASMKHVTTNIKDKSIVM
jgi:glucose-1-phosphate thymidylyltransferase